MTALPNGTVTFLFTDIEDSTRLWEQHPTAMRAAVALHNALLHNGIAAHGGRVFKSLGDGFCTVFAQALPAVTAACCLQTTLAGYSWPPPCALRVRIALHTGDGEPQDGDYVGPPVNRAARLLAVGHGGQILLSQATCDQIRETLPDGASLRGLGAHHLKGVSRAVPIFQLVHPRLPGEFPPLRSLEAIADHLPSEAGSFVGQEREMAPGRGLAVFLEGLAREAGVLGEPERAIRLFAAAAALRERIGAPRPLSERDDYEEHLTATTAQLDLAVFMAAWSEGWAMTAEQALAYALEENGGAALAEGG